MSGAIIPAVLPANREDLEGKLAILAAIPSVARVQIDVVDGKFAAPASWPYSAGGQGGAAAELAAWAREGGALPEPWRIAYEMDLMCLDAERAAGEWLALGASRLTFHAESAIDLERFLAAVYRRYGEHCVSVGLALGIGSDLSLIEPHIRQISYVQFMGIATIGRQGQRFDSRVFEKIRAFRARHPGVAVQVDGGVSLENAKKLIALGVSGLVVGSAILRARDPAAAFAKLDAL